MSRRVRNPMRPKLMLMSVLVASLAGLGAATALAAGDEEAKTKLSLHPCVLVGEDDAGGEAEFESDRGLKVEIWGATLLRGETLAVVVDGERIGTLTVGEDGKGVDEYTSVTSMQEDVGVAVGELEEDTLYASDRELCSDDESSRSN